MRTLTVIFLSTLLLTACGFKGALFLPTDAQKNKSQSAAKPVASAPAVETKQQTSEPLKEQH